MPNEYVMFPVPSDLVPEVARFLYGAAEAPEAIASQPEGATETEWKLATIDQLERIYKESEPKFRRLMLLVAERPDPTMPLPYEEVTTAMGWSSPRSLPGALGAYGRRTKHRYDGAWPMVREKDAADYWSLTMPRELADEVLRLHAEFDLPTSL
ncbi:MAG: hypothetical protein Q7T73_22500 [Beijerinckiaceae bacterium]|nr:hypothetical protein [Beijerinckiaceae bacterium]